MVEKVTAKRAAAALGVSTQTLANWARAGLIPEAERTLGGHRRYDLAKLRRDIAKFQKAKNEETK